MFAFVLSFFLLSVAPAGTIDSVNLFIGTGPGNVIDGVPGGKGGGTQPGAVLPFGMVNFGPDTDRPEQSGYDDSNSFIRGFSLTHLSGPGCRNTGELPMLPVTDRDTWPATGIAFKKEDQSARPGHYRVLLGNGVTVELTATLRTGMAKIHSGNSPFTLLFSTARNGVGETRGDFHQTGPASFRGKVRGGDFCGAKNVYDVFFAIEVSRPVESFSYRNGTAALKFSPEELTVKTGISYVSEAGAVQNLNSENPEFDFTGIKKTAETSWEKALATIDISGGTEDQRTLFYTSLYRSLLHPNLASDVSGDYIGFDNQIHRDEKRPHYQNFSGWDIYRSQVQLLAFLFPKTASDIAQSLVDAGAQCGALPKWSQNNAETSIMVGDPGSIILANFRAFGAGDFDQEKALELMLKSAFDPGAKCQGRTARPGLHEYQVRGYIPEPTAGVWGTAATTLEYASADFAVSVFAESLGKKKEAELLLRRSANWKNLFDPETQLMRPRLADGGFLTPFNPVSLTGFVEGNAHQYTWMVPFDGAGVIEGVGGETVATKKLDQHHTQLNGGLSTPYIYIGNEPCFNTPFLYLWARSPWKTQEVTRRLLSEEFRNSPGGLPGNDDLGALGSFYVWASLGMFPSVPGVGGVVITSPAFPRAVIRPEGTGRSLVLQAESAEKKIYVNGLVVNGVSRASPWISWSELEKSGEIVFGMTDSPSRWGSELTPPSFPGR